MIGGTDLVISGEMSAGDYDLLLRSISAAWPAAILEDALSDAPPCLVSTALRRPILSSEFFMYPNFTAQKKCESEGVTEESKGLMLHFISGEGMMAVVVHVEHGSTWDLAEEIVANIKNNRWFNLGAFELRSAA